LNKIKSGDFFILILKIDYLAKSSILLLFITSKSLATILPEASSKK
jgi:hypothetical protein